MCTKRLNANKETGHQFTSEELKIEEQLSLDTTSNEVVIEEKTLPTALEEDNLYDKEFLLEECIDFLEKSKIPSKDFLIQSSNVYNKILKYMKCQEDKTIPFHGVQNKNILLLLECFALLNDLKFSGNNKQGVFYTEDDIDSVYKNDLHAPRLYLKDKVCEKLLSLRYDDRNIFIDLINESGYVELYITKYGLKYDIVDFIGSLKNVKKLIINYDEVHEIPTNLWKLDGIEILDISTKNNLTSLCEEIALMPSLKHLVLKYKGSPEVFDYSHLKISKCLTDLEIVNEEIKIKTLSDLNLTNLKINGKIYLERETDLPSLDCLTSLKIINGGRISVLMFKKFAKKYPNLEILNFSKTKIDIGFGRYLIKLKNLNSLTLWDGGLTKTDFDLITKMTSLNRLILKNAFIVFGQWSSISNLRNLKYLNISNNFVSKDDFLAISCLKNLKSLILNDIIHDTKLILNNPLDIKHLEEFEFCNNKTTIKDIEFISKLVNLRSLKIGFNNLDIDVGLNYIKKLSNLEILDISLTKLNDSPPKSLLDFKKKLQLSFTNVEYTDKVANEISKMNFRALKFIHKLNYKRDGICMMKKLFEVIKNSNKTNESVRIYEENWETEIIGESSD